MRLKDWFSCYGGVHDFYVVICLLLLNKSVDLYSMVKPNTPTPCCL